MNLDDVGHEWTGDGINAVMPADMDPAVVLPVLIRSLTVNLAADNAHSTDRIRLRMAIGVGLVEHNRAGFGGPMIVEINRLVNSAPVRAALSAYPSADLAVAISDPVHATVIRPGYPGIPSAQFTRVDVIAKEFAAPAWIWVSARQWSTSAYLPVERDHPREIGSYRIVARFGASASGQVFVGRTRDGNPLAVRRYRRELFADADVRRRLSTAVAAASVPHGPYTATVTDSDTESGTPWVARALVRGPSLGTVVTETGPLPAASAAWLALGAARAVAALHEDGLTHQAISPSNVLLEPGGPVLTDFGLNRIALTDGSATAADDVFMLGCVTFFAATGRSPWGGRFPAGPVPATDIPGTLDMLDDQELPGCPPALLPVVRACLDPRSDGRPSAAVLVARLSEIGDQPRSWLPAAVTARFADYMEFPEPDPARRRFRRRFRR